MVKLTSRNRQRENKNRTSLHWRQVGKSPFYKTNYKSKFTSLSLSLSLSQIFLFTGLLSLKPKLILGLLHTNNTVWENLYILGIFPNWFRNLSSVNLIKGGVIISICSHIFFSCKSQFALGHVLQVVKTLKQ